jgi:hypothetical protein
MVVTLRSEAGASTNVAKEEDEDEEAEDEDEDVIT